MYAEIRLRCSSSKVAKQNASDIKAAFEEIKADFREKHDDIPLDMLKLRIDEVGNGDLVIGTHIILPVKSKLKQFMVPDDIKELLKNADQSLDFKVKLGTSLSELFMKEQKLIDAMEQGISAEINLNLISNVRSAVMEILKNHEEIDGSMVSMLTNMIPLAMCQLNG